MIYTSHNCLVKPTNGQSCSDEYIKVPSVRKVAKGQISLNHNRDLLTCDVNSIDRDVAGIPSI